MGGPSVKPYQPDGYWSNLNFPDRTWEADKGDEAISPRLVHLVAADVPASQPVGLRRAHARGVHGRSGALEHAAASAGAVERSDVSSKRPGCSPARILPRRGRPTPTARLRLGLPRSVGRGRPASASWQCCCRWWPATSSEFQNRSARRPRSCWPLARRRRPADLDPAELAAWTQVGPRDFQFARIVTRN